MMSRKGEESNPFYFDGDEDDHSYNRGNTADEEDLAHTRAQIMRSEDRQLQSLDSTLRVLNETEEIGFKTAEELVRQEESLNRTAEKLDSINETTKITQRHITSIKSVFGSFKNRLFGRSEAPPTDNKSDNVQHSKLKETLDEEYSTRRLPTSRSQTSAAGYQSFDSDEDAGLRDISITSSRKAQYDDKLGDISTSLHTLKNLGRGMNRYLTEEEQLLQRITDSTEKADSALKHQNDQLRHLLK